MLINLRIINFINYLRGPIAIIRIIEGENLSGDILVQRYLALSQVQQATSFLLAMNWDSNPNICMHSLNQIINYLFKQQLTPERERRIILIYNISHFINFST